MRAIVIDDSIGTNNLDPSVTRPFPAKKHDEVEVVIFDDNYLEMIELDPTFQWNRKRFIILGDLTPIEEEVEEYNKELV